MSENTRIQISAARWVEILDYLHQQNPTIRSLLLEAFRPGMISAEVHLRNVSDGPLELHMSTRCPDPAQDSIVAWGYYRPPMFTPRSLVEAVNAVSQDQIDLFCSNQIDAERGKV